MGAEEKGRSGYCIRPAEVTDIPFVYNSWLKSYRDAPAVRNVPNSIYFDAHHKLIEGVFGSQGLNVWVACDAQESERIYGYLVAEKIEADVVVHFVYVKHSSRGQGIARALEQEILKLSPERIWFTAQNKALENKLVKERKYSFNPYLFWSKV